MKKYTCYTKSEHEMNANTNVNTLIYVLYINSVSHSFSEVEVETANDFDVRLLGGSQSSGRIEVFYDGSWNGLCMDNLDSKTATVICRSLNYTSGIVQSESQSKKFGIGFSDVWTENITCSGSEFSLKYCSSVKWSKVACHSGSPQPGAICYNDADILSWRLVGGRSDSEGVVEVFVGNAWGTICQHKWDIMVADRVCQKIGFKMALSAVRDSHFKFPLTGTRHVLIDEIVCGDSSNNEASCTFKPSTGVCTDSEYAGVVCTNNDTEINLPIRLVGGETASEGNIQVQHDGEWGYICGTNWNINSSNVVCQMLGLSGATEALVGGFPQDEKYLCRVWLDNVQCSGNETNLWNCKHNGLGVTGCVDERQKAGVKCKGEIGDVHNDPTVGREEECNQLDLETGYTDLRLMTGNNDTTSLGRGRVEVYYKNTWGTVCDDLWDENDAQVVCKSLRFASFSRVGFPREFGTGTGHIWLDDLECVGTEGSLADCIGVKFHPNDCLHVEDASVVCNGPRISRVVEPLSTQEGNDVEIALIVSCVMIVLLGIFVLFVAVFIWRRISKKKHSQSSLTFHVDNPTSSSAIKTDIHFNANSEDVVFINESIQEDLLSKSTSNNGMQLNLYEDDNKDV
jgi:deleted-in-malignant-brain-tumors protein 1